MGQYYRGCIVKQDRTTVDKWLYPHDYDNQSKLMEHSWLKNDYVRTFEELIYKNPQRVVWAGDYADNCRIRKTNVYQRCTQEKKITPPKVYWNENAPRYIINHIKKQYVDKNDIPKDSDGWRLHPLPLLTCEGNGEGSGDFGGHGNRYLVGKWARDLISVDNEPPINYKKLQFDLRDR